MPRQKAIEVTHNGLRRTYVVWYEDDPPARREAIAFFDAAGDLFPAMNFPREVEGMPIEEANEYLRLHPVQELWEGLTLSLPVADDDLSRLEHVTELLRVWFVGSTVSDRGLEHLLWLDRLENLVLYSDRLTDACFDCIRQMSSLRWLDMQGSPHVSRSAFDRIVLSLPQLESSYAPVSP